MNFKPVDRLPRDIGGMRSTCISCFAYPKLVKALGLPPRRPRVYDLGQMLALPDVDVLDALGCDVVMAEPDVTNAFAQPDLWKDSGYIFCNIHNILAEIAPEKVIAMYRAAT